MKIMKKIIKILLSLVLIGLFMIITLSGYIKEKSDISRKLGAKTQGGTLSTIEYGKIIKLHRAYMEYLESGDYEKAYKFFPYNYKQFKDYDTFANEASNANFEEVGVKDIIRRTEKMYSIILNNENEQLIIFNEDGSNFSLVPEPLIEYKEQNQTLKKKKVEYKVINTINYIDKFIVTLEITNLNKKEVVNISDINILDNNEELLKNNFKGLELQPLETKQVTIECKTYIDIPNQIEFLRKFENKNKTEKYLMNI